MAPKAEPKAEAKATALKRKDSDAASKASPAKVAKKEDEEKEQDDKLIAKATPLADAVAFNPSDFTLNCIPTMGGKSLMALTDSGMSYFIAGARANVGMKSGRYAYEMKVYEHVEAKEVPMTSRQGMVPKQMVRIGVSVAGSDLVLGCGSGSVCFEHDAALIIDGTRKGGAGGRFARDQVVTIVLNLDAGSPNANTISLFVNGLRACPAVPLPESCVGKTLYPHVSYKAVSVLMNFGPSLLQELPFKCRTLQQATKGDIVVAQPKKAGAKCEVVFPVGIPEEGIFDWSDRFIQQNPHFVELSDRKILEWAGKSGIQRTTNQLLQGVSAGRASLDKPEFAFGIPDIDSLNVHKLMKTMALLVPRDYFVLELAANLNADSRAEALKLFSPTNFKRTAHVAVGKPDTEFLDKQYERMLKSKQERQTREWKVRKADKEKKKAEKKRQKEAEERRKKLEQERKKKAEELAKKKAEAEAKKKAEEEKKKAEEEKKKAEEEGAEGGMEVEPKKEEDESEVKKEETKEEPKTEEMKVEPKEEEPAPAEEEPEEPDEPEPVAELTEEEKTSKFAPKAMPDLTPAVFNRSLAQFSLPTKGEGFDEIKYAWDKDGAATTYFTSYLTEKKRTTRLEDLKPGTWFNDKLKEWTKTAKEWVQAQKKAKAEEGKKKLAKEKEKKAKEAEGLEVEDEPQPVEPDIYGVENVTDVNGEGIPLFLDFSFEDWTLFQLRYELFLLVKGFSKDADDPDRPGLPEKHFDFYYNKYFARTLTPKQFGKDNKAGLFEMLKDTVAWTEEGYLSVSLEKEKEEEDLGTFLRHTEEKRRQRQRRLDAGDEGAALKFQQMCMQNRSSVAAAPAAKPTSAANPAKATAPAVLGGPQQWRPQWQGGMMPPGGAMYGGMYGAMY